jgi:hypothetical protein
MLLMWIIRHNLLLHWGLTVCFVLDLVLLSYGSLDPAACLITQLSTMPICCPGQMDLLAVDNVCGWCPNGVEDVNVEFQTPLIPANTTCLEMITT